MALAITFIALSLITWVLLLIVIPVSQKIAQFSFPPWGESLWRLAVVALAVNGITMSLGYWHWLVGLLAGFILFWVLMRRWFDVDFFGAIVIIVVAGAVRWWLAVILVPMLMRSLG